jgi:hypothetical protein
MWLVCLHFSTPLPCTTVGRIPVAPKQM